MQRLVQLSDINRLGTILGVWAHPDDESFTCGGLLAAAVQNGQRVVCVTATKGEAGVQDAKRWPLEQLGDIRSEELSAALNILGIKEHHWLGYNDGACDQVDTTQAVKKISDVINNVRPDTILTFGPDGMTGHPDHKIVSAWASRAVRATGLPVDIYHVVISDEAYENYLKTVDAEVNLFFNIDIPPLKAEEECDIFLRLPDDIIDKKCDALRVMPSQTESLFTKFEPDFIRQAYAIEVFVKAI